MRTFVTGIVLVLVMAFAVGCAKKSDRRVEVRTGGKTFSVSAPVESIPVPSKPIGKNEAAAKAPADKADSDDVASTDVKVAAKGLSLEWQEGDHPKLKVKASKGTINGVSGTASMNVVNAELYEKGKLVAKLTAPMLQADKKSNIVIATGGVTIVSTVAGSNIRTIKADRVKWFSKENRMIGDGNVVATGPVTSVKAAAFTADTQLKTVKVYADSAEAHNEIGRVQEKF